MCHLLSRSREESERAKEGEENAGTKSPFIHTRVCVERVCGEGKGPPMGWSQEGESLGKGEVRFLILEAIQGKE